MSRSPISRMLGWNGGTDASIGQAVGRLVKTAYQTGLIEDALSDDGLAGLKVALRHGMDARSIHRLHAAVHPERRALVDRRRQLTYRQADDEIQRLVRALEQRYGVGGGTPVGLMMENRVEYVAAWFALFRLGASGVHISFRASADELEYHLSHSGARLLFCSKRTREVAETVQSRLSDHEVTVIDVDADEHRPRVSSYPRVLEAGARMPRHLEDQRSRRERAGTGSDNIVYTSGTTGRPKGAVRDFTKMGIQDLFAIIERLPVRAADRHLVVAPIYHSGGQVFTLLNAALGATIYLRPHFEPEATLEALSNQRINSIFLVPTMIRRLIGLSDEIFERHRPSDLRVLVSGAAPFPETLRRRAIQQFGARTVHDFYGATELGWVTLINGREMQARPGSVGRPIAGQEVEIRNDGEVCDPGEVGEIWVRSEHTMSGYLDDGEVDDSYRDEGWMTVDDLGYLDDEGYLYLAGRSRDMIISGGVNIYPVEIEDVLVEHPGVDDAGVVGVDDEEWGEKVVAFVVPEGDVTVDELDGWLRERLASYKVPKDWRMIEALPRNPTGKILKGDLEERYTAESIDR